MPVMRAEFGANTGVSKAPSFLDVPKKTMCATKQLESVLAVFIC
jgi:hypothetical protein